MAKEARKKIATVVYIDSDGEEHLKLSDAFTPEAIRWNFHPAGSYMGADEKPEVSETLDLHLADVPESIISIAAAHGLRQKIGDTYAGSDWDQAIEDVATMLERVIDGEWTKEREAAGPRPSMVFDALMEVLLSMGREDTEELRAKAKAACTGADKRKATLANPKVAAVFTRMQEEAAAERARKAAEKAAETEVSDDDMDALLSDD